MTLEQWRQTQKADTLISVGSRSGYMFIGTLTEYDDSIDEVSREVKAQIEKTLRSTEDTVRSVEKALSAGKMRRGDISPASLQKRLNEFTKRRENTAAELRHFKPLRDREVLDVYPRLNPDDGLCVIVEGDENGAVWFKAEYDTLRTRKRRWGM